MIQSCTNSIEYMQAKLINNWGIFKLFNWNFTTTFTVLQSDLALSDLAATRHTCQNAINSSLESNPPQKGPLGHVSHKSYNYGSEFKQNAQFMINMFEASPYKKIWSLIGSDKKESYKRILALKLITVHCIILPLLNDLNKHNYILCKDHIDMFCVFCKNSSRNPP